MATPYADSIASTTTAHVRTGQADTTAADLRAVFGSVGAAVAFLEGLSRGAKILKGNGAPNNADGLAGDAYVDLLTGDLHFKEGTWAFQLSLKGERGYTPRKNIDYRDGYTPQKNIDYRDGNDGKSAYQVWKDAGNTGNEATFLASLKATDGGRGARVSSSESAPLPVLTDQAGDVHFQTLSNERFRVFVYGGDWQAIYTTPAGATVADKSITAAKMADDVAIGSISAAQNAYPQADRAALTSVERFLVWIGPKITDLFSRIGALDTGFGSLSSLVNGFSARITALEARPVGGGSSSSGTGTATYPAQSANTAGKVLTSSGAAGGESWSAITNNRVGWLYSFKNEIGVKQRFFKAFAVSRIEKDEGISTLSYSVNGATAVQVVFTDGVFIPAANSPLVFPKRALVTWSITYAANFTEAFFEVEGTETV